MTIDVPDVLGYPPEDTDRLATDGGVTSAMTLYPKGVWTPTDWLDVYGGLLLAWVTAPIADPYTTRTQGGGQARNALGRTPSGAFLGAEIDLGLRVGFEVPDAGLMAVASVEYGVLLPGGALDGMEPVHAARFNLAVTTTLTVDGDGDQEVP